MGDSNNIIIFPTLRDSLKEIERESYEAIQELDYETALHKLNYLLSHQYCSYDIHVSKLICHIKLNDLAEAEKFCESLVIDSNDPYYYDYLEYYIMILYEREKYAYLIELIDREEQEGKIPGKSKKKFRDIYRLAYQMNLLRSDELMREFKISIKEENHQRQWYIINKWNELNAEPPELLFTILKEPKIHPMIKTLIIESLRKMNINKTVEVEKFGDNIKVQLDSLPIVEDHPTFKHILNLLLDTEQENPTLFLLIKDLLYQFNYIQYPHMYTEEEMNNIANALLLIASENLALDNKKQEVNSNIKNYKNMIQLCNEMYLNISLH
ncbi:hypothetical protein SPD48_09120 [Pseudogracilibacillus sp. SE30717A]|uniref:hypothetical protein n=1 Tax=Pseudogracilibacillus sp. SE30717A TaxID=3098293 RepID=UPI00300E2523